MASDRLEVAFDLYRAFAAGDYAGSAQTLQRALDAAPDDPRIETQLAAALKLAAAKR